MCDWLERPQHGQLFETVVAIVGILLALAVLSGLVWLLWSL